MTHTYTCMCTHTAAAAIVQQLALFIYRHIVQPTVDIRSASPPREYKYFELKKNTWCFRPNLNYLLSSVASQDMTTCMSMRCNSICPYNKYEHTQFHTGMGAQAQTDCVYMHFLSFFSNNLTSHTHMLYRLATLYFCVSRYEHN